MEFLLSKILDLTPLINFLINTESIVGLIGVFFELKENTPPPTHTHISLHPLADDFIKLMTFSDKYFPFLSANEI